MALLGNGYRTASIRCLTDSYFGVLDLQSFTDILLEIEERKILLNLNYLHKVDLFKDWNDKDLKIIFFNSVEVNYRYQDVVYKYGSNSDFIYIIKKGRFEVIKALPTYARATLRVAFPTLYEGNPEGCACVIWEATLLVAPPGRGYININILGTQSI